MSTIATSGFAVAIRRSSASASSTAATTSKPLSRRSLVRPSTQEREVLGDDYWLLTSQKLGATTRRGNREFSRVRSPCLVAVPSERRRSGGR